MPNKRLSHELMTAFKSYMKWRHGHHPPNKYWDIYHSIMNSLKNGDQDLRDKFLTDVNTFLDTNEEIIKEAQEGAAAVETRKREADQIEKILIGRLN